MGIKTLHILGGRPVLWTALWLGCTAAVAGTVPTVTVGSVPTGAGFELDGSVEALRQATVAAQVSGNVTALAVKAGDKVRAGQLLARIDARDTSAGLLQSNAALAQAQAQLENARLNADRQRELRRQGFVSQSVVDQADTTLKAAQAAVDQAKGARSQAALARGFADVVAPFDGVVQSTLVDTGDLASAGRSLLTMYAPGALRAVVQVPSTRAALARAASHPQVRLPDGQWVTPVRRTELPATDPVAQTIEWRLDLPTGTALTPGQSLRVRFDAPAAAVANVPAALSVPASAVLRRGELEAVYVVSQGQFVLRSVRLGTPTAAQQVPVLAGLKSGDQVAVDAVQAGLAGATPAKR